MELMEGDLCPGKPFGKAAIDSCKGFASPRTASKYLAMKNYDQLLGESTIWHEPRF